ncbi:MAG TPA: hypothetical protein VFV38_43935 [Ktedonobacteraceae bacterium]|nr:hypothetical protein [Ktedonobacteraceae bacterium]
MPENSHPSSESTSEPQRWIWPSLGYTEVFHAEITDGGEKRVAAAIAARLYASFLELSPVVHARWIEKILFEQFPLPVSTSGPDELVVVRALSICLIRWQNEIEDLAHPTREETTAVSHELVILALSLLHPAWVMVIPDPPQPASAADERLLAALGYSSERLALALTEHALDATSARLRGLIRRLAAAVRQAVDEELAEALRNLYYPQRLTERRARELREKIAEEIREDASLIQYFSTCRRIEVEPAGRTEYQVHVYFEAYGRHYGEMWVQSEKQWRREADKIRREVTEGGNGEPTS